MTVALVSWMVFALFPSAWYYGWVLPLLPLWVLRERILIGAHASAYLITTQAWLFPVAAIISSDPRLGLVDRLAAPLLGVTTVFGVALVAWLLRPPPAFDAVPAGALRTAW